MNKTINKFLLVGNKFIAILHLRQPEFTYSAWDHLLNIVKEYKDFQKQVI